MKSYKRFVTYFIIQFRVFNYHPVLKIVLSISRATSEWRMQERDIYAAIHSWADVETNRICVSIHVLVTPTKRREVHAVRMAHLKTVEKTI